MRTDELLALRRLAPDLTLHYDKQAILDALAPLCLDIEKTDGDERISIYLENNYYITWRPNAASKDGDFGWAVLSNGAFVQMDNIINNAASEAEADMRYGQISKFLKYTVMHPVVMYRVWATLHHTTKDSSIKVAPIVLRDHKPDALLRDSLVWFQSEMKVPLKLRHTDYQGSVGQVSE